MMTPELAGSIAADIPLVLGYAGYLSWQRIPMPLALFPSALLLLANVPLLRAGAQERDYSNPLAGAALGVLLWLAFLSGGGRGSKWWGKIKRAALTLVSAERFRQQVKEVTS